MIWDTDTERPVRLHDGGKLIGAYEAVAMVPASLLASQQKKLAEAKRLKNEYREGWLLRGRQMNEDRIERNDLAAQVASQQERIKALEAALRELPAAGGGGVNQAARQTTNEENAMKQIDYTLKAGNHASPEEGMSCLG